MDVLTYALAKKYVDQTANALGAVKGAPCTIKGIEPCTDGTMITFEWQGTDGVMMTQSITIPHGAAEAIYVAIVDGDTIAIENDHVYTAAAPLTSLTLTVPEEIDLDFRCVLIFECGDTATEFVYPTSIMWTGDNLDSSLRFVPVHNKRYTIDIWYDGAYLRANASGVIV